MTCRRRFLLAVSVLMIVNAPAMAEGVVNVYSYRQPALVEPLFAAFTRATGIAVRTVFAENGLVERMAQEGRNSPADVLLSADVGRLLEATKRDLAQPIASDKISGNVPANLRDKDNLWFGLTMRARVIYAARARVAQDTISYEDLAEPKWKGKICIRTGGHPYNLGLIAAMIAHKGEGAARAWLQGVKANLAVKPNGNDRAQAKSVYAGECDLAIANTYYMGIMMSNDKEPEQKEWARALRIMFPASPDFGTHVNISGMLMAKNAPHRENALKLMEYLASDEAQRLYADGNFEYPVNPAVKPSEIVQAWGAFSPDALQVSELGRFEADAARLVDEVGFDD